MPVKRAQSTKKKVASVIDKSGKMQLVQIGGSKKRTKGNLKKGCPMPLGGGCENTEKESKKLKVCKPNTFFKLRVFPDVTKVSDKQLIIEKGDSVKPEQFGFSVEVRPTIKKCKDGVSKVKNELILCAKQESDLHVVASSLHKLLNQKFLDCLFHPDSAKVDALAGAKKVAALLKLHRQILSSQKVISSAGEIKTLLKKMLNRMVYSKDVFNAITNNHIRMLAYSAYAPMKVAREDAYFIGWEDSLVVMAVVFKKLFDKHLPKICQVFEHKC